MPISRRFLSGQTSSAAVNLAVLLLSVAVLVVLGEGALRLVGYGRGVQFQYLEQLGWVHQPDQRATTIGGWDVRIDSLGFRGPGFAVSKGHGTYRILVVGDSFTFGYGVAEDSTYARLLQRGLTRALPCTRFEVLNAGVNGYNTVQEVEFVAQRGLVLDPDLVIIGLTPNDVMDQEDTRAWRRWLGLKKWAAGTALYQFLVPRMKAVFLSGKRRRYDHTMAQFAGRPDSVLLRRLEGVVAALDRLQALGQQHRFDVVVAALPLITQIDAPSGAWLSEYLDSAAGQSGFHLIDLLPAFRAVGDHDSLFLDEPTRHPSPAGHRIVAMQVELALIEREVLPLCTPNAGMATNAGRR